VTERGGVAFVRLRGTKTKKSAREVPVLGVARTLLAWSLAAAWSPERGPDPIFPRWASVRRDLHAACARAGIAAISPNDLRRTFATWAQKSGAGNDLVAQMMGHTDTRMVERVYGRMSSEDVARLLRARIATAEPRGEGRQDFASLPVDRREAKGARTRAGDAPARSAGTASSPNRALFPLAAARAVLTDLALRSGITVTP
jgi:hypothetical protein